jgi:mannose-6-phosphate isomerase-like protein (cupin superfamily)
MYIFYNLLTPDSMSADTTVILVHCEPHAETYGGVFHVHTTEEVIYVLSGKATIVFESAQFEISEGDTVRIPPNYKHRYINTSDEVVEILTVKARGRA